MGKSITIIPVSMNLKDLLAYLTGMLTDIVHENWWDTSEKAANLAVKRYDFDQVDRQLDVLAYKTNPTDANFAPVREILRDSHRRFGSL